MRGDSWPHPGHRSSAARAPGGYRYLPCPAGRDTINNLYILSPHTIYCKEGEKKMTNYLLSWTDGNRQFSREFDDYNEAVMYFNTLCMNPVYDVKVPIRI